MNQKAKELIAPLSPTLDACKPMSALSVAEQQLVEIVKALSRNARIMIMDGADRVFDEPRCEELYRITENLRDQGYQLSSLPHKFEDMHRLASRVTADSGMRSISAAVWNQITNHDLISKMVGRELNQMYPEKTAQIGQVVFLRWREYPRKDISKMCPSTSDRVRL